MAKTTHSVLDLKKFSWKPSVPDHRDREFVTSLSSLPSKVLPITGFNPVEDQGILGSCTGNATTTAIEIITQSSPLSRLFAYYHGRKFEGTIKVDAGAMIRDVIKGVSFYGVCKESVWRYDISKFARTPPSIAYKDALVVKPKISSYERVISLNKFKTALAMRLPVIFGFSVPDYFTSSTVAKTGWLPFPSVSSKIIGGHAVTAVGYDDTAPEPYIHVRNSWGSAWGINGDFKMPYAWFENIDRSAGLVADCWIIHPNQSIMLK